MFVLARTIAYATLFVGLVLVFVPSSLLSWSGVPTPAHIGIWQGAGVLVGALGAAVALWCIFTFAFVGKGTPAPFDPPRRLVIKGPYRLVRNPMYLGAALALAGAALFYESLALAGYTGVFLLTTHVFVVTYEEPALQRTFGDDYEAYCGTVRRWQPKPNRPSLVSPSQSRPSRDRHR
jgi:protein-S-isoprenylcysteine O-methyltransferase Ste14